MALRKTLLKKKVKKTFVDIDVPIYGGWVIVSINQSNEEFIKSFIKSRKSDRSTAEYYCSLVNQDIELEQGKTAHLQGNVIVRVYSDLKTAFHYNTLVHELFHATDFILDYKGLKLVDGSDEAYCYLIGYLMEKTMEAHL